MSHDTDPRPAVTRRQALGITGAGAGALLLQRLSGPKGLLEDLGLDAAAQAATASCSLTPAKTEGPYFVDEHLTRSDIRTDPGDGSVQPGVPLNLTLVVVSADGQCAPVPGAVVDIWHANAQGRYSDEAANQTAGKKYLRGNQTTDAAGQVHFTTVYPGWYSGRAIHIHFKVRLYDGSTKTYEFTSQMFFDPAVSSTVMKTSAYSAHGQPDTLNSTDNIYGDDGAKLLVPLTGDGNGGYAGTFVVGVSGLPATTTTTTTGTTTTGATVQAALRTASFRRTTSGRRILHTTQTIGETVTVDARLTRAGKTLAHKQVKGLTAGARTLDVRIPQSAAGGSARLTLTFTDAGGASKTVHRTVKVPRRAA